MDMTAKAIAVMYGGYIIGSDFNSYTFPQALREWDLCFCHSMPEARKRLREVASRIGRGHPHDKPRLADLTISAKKRVKAAVMHKTEPRSVY